MKKGKNPWISDLRWVRTARQRRSERTLGALLDAAEALISEKGIDDTTVADVAARAGCSVGAFYHHFRDKRALVYGLIDQLREEHLATTREAVEPERWDGASIEEILRTYLEFALEIGRERPGLKRAQVGIALRDPQVAEQLGGLKTEFDRGLRALLAARRAQIGRADPERAIDFVLEQLRAMLELRLTSVYTRTPLSSAGDAEFVDEALASVRSYLELETARRSG